MKTCPYCDRENSDGEVHCHECGSELLIPEKIGFQGAPESAVLPESPLINLNTLENAFRFEEGFSRPDWKTIYKTIEEQVPPEHLHRAWVEVALQWLIRLRDELGGYYHVTESLNFILLDALDEEGTHKVLTFAERALHAICTQLQDVAWSGYHGKHVILVFMEDDDYYQYQAPFLRDGMNVASGGVMLGGGYVHIALPYHDGRHIRPTLAHELTHNCVAHLPLPLWLNEGVAMRVERHMTRPTEPVLNQELADQNRNFWTETNIQHFWAGTSFYEPGDSQTLSYSLAEILVQMLSGDHQRFLDFLRQAQYADAGQTAALDCLGTNLGDVAATFLGPGNWRPYRKALVECWNNASKAKNPSVPDSEQVAEADNEK